MYLQRIRAHNFRVFGDNVAEPALDWELSPGMNILIGENDAGKTAIVDAVRQVLWTTSYETVRLHEIDFHISKCSRAESLFIEATLVDLSPDQEAAVLEWLTYESDGSRSLILHLRARWVAARGKKRGRVEAPTRSGRDGTGPEIGSAVRDLVRSTYLRPLRDAEAELRPGRYSRLSQILGAHKSIEGQDENDFSLDAPAVIPKKLVGLMAFAQHHLGEHDVIKGVESDINNNYLTKFAFAGDALSSHIRIAADLALQPILEKFELSLLPSAGIHPDTRCARGLGYNNALFMATELVLLRDGDELALLLIEEPESHLHPQLQDRVQQLLEQSANEPEKGSRRVQVVMTTHSSTLVAGADIACMTLVHRARTFRLGHDQTKLNRSDYKFLRRFIDATKANFFFARGVAIVEGTAEALLLPALAEACGCSFSHHGVSVVNVGNVGLYHYARVLQRADESVAVPVPVVCITDRDVVPDVASDYVAKSKRRRFESEYTEAELAALVKTKEERAAGGSTIVCVSDRWTFEYDLALYGCADLMYTAIEMAKRAKSKGERLDEADEVAAVAEAAVGWKKLEASGHNDEKRASVVYQPLAEGDASKAVAAQYAAHLVATGQFGAGEALFNKLPPYIQRALQHLTGKDGAA
jgi:putative ATP-dependent endonuclease of OLD family